MEGRPEAALARLEPLANASGLDWLCAIVMLTVLAWTYLDLGDAARAEEIADRAVAEAMSMHNHVEMLGAQRIKGMALMHQGRWE